MKQLRKFGGLRQFGMLTTPIRAHRVLPDPHQRSVLTPTNLMNLFNGNSYILILSMEWFWCHRRPHRPSVVSVAALVPSSWPSPCATGTSPVTPRSCGI